MYNFEFVQPGTVEEAAAAMGGDEAQALGGGQTLIPTMKQRLASPATLVSLTGIAEMKGLCVRDDGALAIGGPTTHATVAAGVGIRPALHAALVPAVVEQAGLRVVQLRVALTELPGDVVKGGVRAETRCVLGVEGCGHIEAVEPDLPA